MSKSNKLRIFLCLFLGLTMLLDICGFIVLPKQGNGGVAVSTTAKLGTAATQQENIFDLTRHALSNLDNQIFQEPEASVVSGLLFGEKTAIAKDVILNFNRSGLSHILAISGFNITIIINLLAVLLKYVPRRARFWLTLMVIGLFSLLTGATASVLRAAFMGAIVLLAMQLGRKGSTINALLITAAVLVFIEPTILIHDVSFQLSFLATLGLVTFSEEIEAKLMFMPEFFRADLAVTLSAQLFTLPITAFNFGIFSLISPLANIVVLPFVPLMMLTSFLAFLSYFFIPFLSWIFILPTAILIRGMLLAADFFANLPFAYIQINKWSGLEVFAYYFALGLFISVYKRKSKQC